MNRRNVLREKLKERFIELHKELFDKIIPTNYGWGDGYKSKVGKRIILLAREKIGFKKSYVDMDLFRALMNKYKKLNDEKS